MSASSTLSSGCSGLDNITGGGFSRGKVTFLYGEAGTGKTTILLQTALEAHKHSVRTIFVDADQSLSHQRLSQMALGFLEDFGGSTIIFQPENFQQQSSLVESLQNYLTPKFGLVGVDSITGLYRASLGPTARTFSLNRELNRQMAYLADLATSSSVAVIVNGQVHAQLSSAFAQVEPVARRVVAHWASKILSLRRTANPNVIEAVVEKHSGSTRGPDRCFFKITESGVEDA